MAAAAQAQQQHRGLGVAATTMTHCTASSRITTTLGVAPRRATDKPFLDNAVAAATGRAPHGASQRRLPSDPPHLLSIRLQLGAGAEQETWLSREHLRIQVQRTRLVLLPFLP